MPDPQGRRDTASPLTGSVAAVSRTIPQLQVVAPLLHADDVQPWRRFRKKLHAGDQFRALRLHVSARHLRG